MIFPSNRVRIMVATKPIDFRKGHDSLAAMVKNELRKDPFTDAAARPIASFAKGIAADQAAVLAALMEPWSNGQTEGQINRLKLIKRQMYGRAHLDLLRARVIGTAMMREGELHRM